MSKRKKPSIRGFLDRHKQRRQNIGQPAYDVDEASLKRAMGPGSVLSRYAPVFLEFPDQDGLGILIFMNKEGRGHVRITMVESRAPLTTDHLPVHEFHKEVYSTRIYSSTYDLSCDTFLEIKNMIIRDLRLIDDPTPLVNSYGGRMFGREPRIYSKGQSRRLACSD